VISKVAIAIEGKAQHDEAALESTFGIVFATTTQVIAQGDIEGVVGTRIC
jgi:hypothetical protein